ELSGADPRERDREDLDTVLRLRRRPQVEDLRLELVPGRAGKRLCCGDLHAVSIPAPRTLAAMVTIVIPFAGPGGKTRLHDSAEVRDALAEAMFGDVLAACRAVGPTRVADLGGGQGAAVATALAGVEGPVVVVN